MAKRRSMNTRQQIPSSFHGRLLALSALVLVTLAGCVSAPANDSAGASKAAVPLSNTYWQLVRVGQDAVPDPENKRPPHILFLDDGRVQGFSGCNQYRGNYRVAGDNLLFDAMSSTRMACRDSQTEQRLFAAFANTVGVNLDGTRLRLLGDNARVLAEFEAVTRR